MNRYMKPTRSLTAASLLAVMSGGDTYAATPADILTNWWTTQYAPVSVSEAVPVFSDALLTRAPVDECYDGDWRSSTINKVGSTNSITPVNAPNPCGTPKYPPTSSGSPNDASINKTLVPKINENYVWSTVLTDVPQSVINPTRRADLWFGSMANTWCVIQGGQTFLTGLNPLAPQQSGNSSPSSVCEFDKSWVARDTTGELPPANNPDGLILPATHKAMGDWRPPRLRIWDTLANSNPEIDVTDLIRDRSATDKTRLNTTLGLRAAGSNNSIVVAAGPTVTGSVGGQGVNFFFFKASTRAYLGSCTLNAYNDIRKFAYVNNVLYTTVRTTNGRGAVLRFAGTGSTASTLCRFTEVGRIDNMGGEIVVLDNRLYVGTWWDHSRSGPINDIVRSIATGAGVPPRVAGIWRSPILPSGGLNGLHVGQWTKVWDWDRYDPDFVAARTLQVSVMAAYGGWLYWGSMQQPGITLSVIPAYATPIIINGLNLPALMDLDYGNGAGGAPDGQLNEDEFTAAYLGTYRPTPFLRAKNLGAANQQIELLYGDQYLPVYDRTAKTYTIAADSKHLNRTGQAPKFSQLAPSGATFPTLGSSGFGCWASYYTWTMTVTKAVGNVPSRLLIGNPDATVGGCGSNIATRAGANLFHIDDPASGGPAIAENLNGLGNASNFGLRNMVPSSTGGAYLGTANINNLRAGSSRGGWELHQLTPVVP